MDIKFYYVNPEYIDFLKKAEIDARGFTCVPNTNYANNEKFFYGAVLTRNNGINYFVPISHNINEDQNSILIKTDDKRNPIKGTLRFAYMIPVPKQMLTELVIKELSNYDNQRRTQKELAFCRKNRDKIFAQALKSHQSITNASSIKLRNNSCAFEILERAYIEFCKQKNIDISNIVITAPAPEHPKTASVEPTQNLSALQAENDALKKELAQATATCDKRTETIRTANAVLAANPELKKAFVEEKRKLLQQPTTSQKKPSPPVPPQQPKKGNKPKH